MVWIKRLLVVALVTIAALSAWSYFMGGLKMQRDIAIFATAMEDCSPLSQEMGEPIPGIRAFRAILGREGDACRIEMSTTTPQVLDCRWPMEDMAAIAASFARQADLIDFFGGTRLVIDTSSDDPFYTALNNGSCDLVES